MAAAVETRQRKVAVAAQGAALPFERKQGGPLFAADSGHRSGRRPGRVPPQRVHRPGAVGDGRHRGGHQVLS